MAARQLPLPGEIIKKSNALCRARWSVSSVYEPRLVALVASKVRADDLDFHDYEIPVSEILGTRADGRSYALLAEAVDGLMGRIVTTPKPGGGWAKCSIFSYCEYDPTAGTIKVHFDPKMKPHYLGLNANFTQYNLIEFLLLPSTYSQRVYELLKSWTDKPETTINLSELHEIVDAPESLKKDFAGFRRRVLEKAHKDINGKTTLVYDWEPIKKGRAVVAIRFIFSEKRVQEQKTKKKKAANTKRSADNNEVFMEMMKCHGVCGGQCKETLSKKHCELCRKLNGKQGNLFGGAAA